MMWWHPIVSVAVGFAIGYCVVGPLWRKRKRRQRDELEAWRHQQRIRG